MVDSLLTVPTMIFSQAAISVMGHCETPEYVSASCDNRSTGLVVPLALLNISLGRRQGSSQCYLSSLNVLFRLNPASTIILHVPSCVNIGIPPTKCFTGLTEDSLGEVLCIG